LQNFGSSIIQEISNISEINKLDGDIEIYWWEFTQIRYIEEFTSMNLLIDICISQGSMPVADEFYEIWSTIQSRCLQILVPLHWGRWADYNKLVEIPEYTGLPLDTLLIHIKNNPEFEKELIEKATNSNIDPT
jgi:hypothetical protein